MKHTQGNWHSAPTGEVMQGYKQPFGVAIPEKSILIAGCFGDIPGGAEQAEANAKLIAAAPELLEALIMAFNCLKATYPTFNEWAEYPIIKNAINKATE